MQEWTIKSLDDDNIPKDSDFYEYIGRMIELEEFLREIELKYKDNQLVREKIGTELDKIIGHSFNINELRFKYYKTLLGNGEVPNLSSGDMKDMTYSEASRKGDEIAQHMANEFNELIEKGEFEKVKIVAKYLDEKLQRIYKIDSFIFDKVNEKLKDKEPSAEIHKEEYDSDLFFPHGAPIPQNNFHYDKNGYYVAPSQVQETPTPVPAPIPEPQPVFKQSPRNYRSVRKRKVNLEKVNKLLKGASIGLLSIAAGLVLWNATIGKDSLPVDKSPKPSPTPDTSIKMTSEQPRFGDKIINEIVNGESKKQVPSAYTPATYISDETPAPKKGTLSYALQHMDDEMISVVANSLKESVTGLSSLNLNMYGNGCHDNYSSDREMVEAVFKVLDEKAQTLSEADIYNLKGDKYSLALQMRQLSGDLAKYLIARSIGESGKYKESNYSIDDIDIYYRTNSGDVATHYDIRTLRQSNNSPIEDELISREYSTKGVLNTLVTSYCTLDNALNKTVIGTQEGCIIDTYSLKAYRAISDILSNDLSIDVNSQGKGITIKTMDKNIDPDR